MPNSTHKYRVAATGLNFRTRPEVSADTRIAVLPEGHNILIVGSAEREGWVMVSTEVDGQSLTGFVARRFLMPVSEFDDPERLKGVTEVHLAEDRRQARRDVNGQRAFPIGEPDRPTRDPEGKREEKLSSLTEIVNWLDVENSARYQPTGGRTFCNIYAHDYCYLANVYLPRTWWRDKALLRLGAGEGVRPIYDTTLREMNVNSLFDWLREWGPNFGWKHIFSLDELQDEANNGEVGVIIAQRRDLGRSGHITVAVPEHGEHRAVRRRGEVTRPLQSQAGTQNFKYGNTHWWSHRRFRDFAFWVQKP